MKKLVLFAALISLTTLSTVSCSKDDDKTTELPNPNPNPNPNEQPLSLEADVETLYIGGTVTFQATLGGSPVTDAVYYVNGAAISGNTYTQDTVGTVTVIAKKAGNADSNELTITFEENPFEGIEGNAIFKYNGTEYTADKSVTIYWGSYYTDETETAAYSLFSTYAYNTDNWSTATNFADFELGTPYDLTAQQIQIPNATNATYIGVYAAKINGQDVAGEDGLYGGTGTVVYNSFLTEADPVTVDLVINANETGHTFIFDYDGTSMLLDGSQKPAPVVAAKGKINRPILEKESIVKKRLADFRKSFKK